MVSAIPNQIAASNALTNGTLSIVSPFLNEAESAPAFTRMLAELERIVAERFGLSVEVILVDDGSTDGSAAAFSSLLQGRWKIVQLSRNFGKEIALFAGIEAARGDLVLLMDADLQHSMAVSLQLIEAIVNDPQTDVVYAVRGDRRESGLMRLGFSRLFYKLINVRQRFTMPPDAGDFRIMRASVARAFTLLRDKKRFNKGLYAWAGFRQKSINYIPEERVAGVTRWSKFGLLALSKEGFTSFSALPLRVLSSFGFLLAFAGVAYGIKILLEVMFYGIVVPGYPSLMVAILVIGGFNLALLGMLGEYLWVTLSETKDRPLYIVRETLESTPAKTTAPADVT
ncbi:glycosyltransferase family 2 protein [Aerobium aerolatum]|uniref:Glycosyltransferase involved in cell wall bisynthesis n=1 Tax=Aquamicrobium aerolatum DSM 21857 TaxID=1121003 RepID=A0A1I3L0T0_9HYPH|nr:glycosyltransferase family 2 protein [Aquamicrobium aerolatum]SFI78310.1 Glycosyltransferase involved in cell wall bisynthesis [Aquamicrobium aerolatum DSM 21857]